MTQTSVTQQKYTESFEWFKSNYDTIQKKTSLEKGQVRIEYLDFISLSEQIFPKNQSYYEPHLAQHQVNWDNGLRLSEMKKVVAISDAEIQENRDFQYILMIPKEEKVIDEVIILLHGLNEKDWIKYLPWAEKLVELTGKGVLLFPLAFHINRSAQDWKNTRLMNSVSKERIKSFQNLSESSFTNSALSTRLHFAPVRFFLSGLQTYQDITQLISYIRLGNHPYISETAKVNFFGYSAGAFLSAIILMANRNNLFNHSKAVFFCGGAMLSRMHLTSRYIMDNFAYESLLNFYVDDFEKTLSEDSKLKNLFNSTRYGGTYFQSMLSEKDNKFNQIRNERFSQIHHQIKVFSLEQDTIIPSSEINKTLNGNRQDNLITIQELNFPYAYTHMNPFHFTSKNKDLVSQTFNTFFEEVADFFL